MVRRVDINIRLNFGTNVVFHYLFYQLNPNCIDVRTNFGTKLVFRYLFYQSEIQIVVRLIFQIVS